MGALWGVSWLLCRHWAWTFQEWAQMCHAPGQVHAPCHPHYPAVPIFPCLPTWTGSSVMKEGAQRGCFSPTKGRAFPCGWGWGQPERASGVRGDPCWLPLAWLSVWLRCCFLPHHLALPLCADFHVPYGPFSDRLLPHGPPWRPQRSLAAALRAQLETVLHHTNPSQLTASVCWGEMWKSNQATVFSALQGPLAPLEKQEAVMVLGVSPFFRAASGATHLMCLSCKQRCSPMPSLAT